MRGVFERRTERSEAGRKSKRSPILPRHGRRGRLSENTPRISSLTSTKESCYRAPVSDLSEFFGPDSPLQELLPGLERFEAEGFAAYRDEWRQRDLLAGHRLRFEGNGGFRYGRAVTVEDDGGLRVDIDGYGLQVLYAADVSIHDE